MEVPPLLAGLARFRMSPCAGADRPAHPPSGLGGGPSPRARSFQGCDLTRAPQPSQRVVRSRHSSSVVAVCPVGTMVVRKTPTHEQCRPRLAITSAKLSRVRFRSMAIDTSIAPSKSALLFMAAARHHHSPAATSRTRDGVIHGSKTRLCPGSSTGVSGGRSVPDRWSRVQPAVLPCNRAASSACTR